MSDIMKTPCPACPYRKDVPSGVWSSEEYDKLPPYDLLTAEQPVAVFACHEANDKLCHGWALCHTSRGSEFDLLALRILSMWYDFTFPALTVPLFASGREACDHGKREIAEPTTRAVVAIQRIKRKRGAR